MGLSLNDQQTDASHDERSTSRSLVEVLWVRADCMVGTRRCLVVQYSDSLLPQYHSNVSRSLQIPRSASCLMLDVQIDRHVLFVRSLTVS